MLKKTHIALILLVTIIVSTIVGYQYITKPVNFINPEANNPNTFTHTSNTNYIILGFLPYWLLNQSENIQYNHLTDIAYFGIEFDDQGKLKTRLEDGTRELGYHRLNQNQVQNVIKTSHQNQVRPILTVKILNNPGIEAAISPRNRNEIINQILQITNQNTFSGINIDFEYIHTPSEDVKNNFTEFIKILRQQTKADNLKLTIDVYADAADKQSQRLWQLTDLAPHIDQFIIMGYDYHRTTTPQSGPVAPIHGSPEYWDEDLSSNLRSYMQHISSQKIILGIPFYGYEWTTISTQPLSATIKGSGKLATYTRVVDILKECQPVQTLKQLETSLYTMPCLYQINSLALQPHLRYRTKEQTQQIWFENSNSIQYKLQLVKQANLAGIAIWALGYETPHNDFWVTINQELQQNSN